MATQSNTTPTTADRARDIEDDIRDLTTGTKLMIESLDRIFDAGLELDIEEGADVMDATIAALWLARRLSNDAQTILREFNQDRVDQVRAELAQATK